MPSLFESRNPFYRSPCGAVKNGEPVHFKISLPRSLSCRGAYLVVQDDQHGDKQISSMFWCGMNGDDHEFWECHHIASAAGIYWYHFELDCNTGRRRIERAFGGEGTLQKGGVFQLTVYEEDFSTPDWLAGGVMYQIFPDRFYRSGEEKKDVPIDRVLHESFEGTPNWRPDDKGTVKNDDYFGGDLIGIREKLPYLKDLGVTCIYLNPIFEAHSNHRYNTANYEKIDPLLGTEDDFTMLCDKAREYGIRILIDGVFSHTGSDSLYFNREGRYGERAGAYRDQASPYYSWFQFANWPDKYSSWWGFDTLPEVIETAPSYREYITGENGILRRWMRAGASGWRLDVADELPDSFLDAIREAVKAEDQNAIVLGEVWEDASTKESYGHRRRYLLGRQLDSVMNYPFRDAVLGFLTGQEASLSMEHILTICENYPPQALRLLMNHLGTHDTERAITVLAGEQSQGRGRDWQAQKHLSDSSRDRGLRLMRLASAMQFTLPGVPCIYYGDETGMEGYRDPFNRAPYPWNAQNEDLIKWYQALGKLRKTCPALKEGELSPLYASGHMLCYLRRDGEHALLCAFHSGMEKGELSLPEGYRYRDALTGLPFAGRTLHLMAESCRLLLMEAI